MQRVARCDIVRGIASNLHETRHIHPVSAIRLVVTFEDEDHFAQEWTWREGGKEGTVAFRLERMK